MTRFEFEVMQPMDRPVHRWDTCCRDWWDQSWSVPWALLRAGQWRAFLRLLPSSLQPFIGTCPWHGLQTR